MIKGFTLEVVKVKGHANWAIKATLAEGRIRYRGYHYKRDAEKGMETWADCHSGYFRDREFMHNFYSSEELGITPINK